MKPELKFKAKVVDLVGKAWAKGFNYGMSQKDAFNDLSEEIERIYRAGLKLKEKQSENQRSL